MRAAALARPRQRHCAVQRAGPGATAARACLRPSRGKSPVAATRPAGHPLPIHRGALPLPQVCRAVGLQRALNLLGRATAFATRRAAAPHGAAFKNGSRCRPGPGISTVHLRFKRQPPGSPAAPGIGEQQRTPGRRPDLLLPLTGRGQPSPDASGLLTGWAGSSAGRRIRRAAVGRGAGLPAGGGPRLGAVRDRHHGRLGPRPELGARRARTAGPCRGGSEHRPPRPHGRHPAGPAR